MKEQKDTVAQNIPYLLNLGVPNQCLRGIQQVLTTKRTSSWLVGMAIYGAYTCTYMCSKLTPFQLLGCAHVFCDKYNNGENSHRKGF